MNQAEIVQSREERDAIVAAYKEAGLGGERYGVVCPIIDEETGRRCNRRICPQGWAAAMQFNAELNKGTTPKAGLYCLHRENYDGSEQAEDITSILNTHGLEWRPLRTLRRMRENKPNKKGKKNGKAKQGSAERAGDYPKANGGRAGEPADGTHSSFGLRSGDEPSLVSEQGGGQGPTFRQFLNGKVDEDSRSSLAPSDGRSRRPRLFLARREREAEEARRQAEGLRTSPEDSN